MPAAIGPPADARDRGPHRVPPLPHDADAAPRAAARRRPQAVRGEGLRGHQRRGDRRARRGVQAGRVRALRRQGRRLRGRRRPRDPGAPRRAHRGALTGGAPAGAGRAARARAARLHRELADGFRILVRDSPVAQATGTFASLIGDVATQVEHLLAASSSSRGLDPKTAPHVRADARRHGRADRAVVARRAEARQEPTSPRTW